MPSLRCPTTAFSVIFSSFVQDEKYGGMVLSGLAKLGRTIVHVLRGIANSIAWSHEASK